jgi:hypothetical protein
MQADNSRIVIPPQAEIPEAPDWNDPVSLVCDNCGVKGDGVYIQDPFTKRAIHKGNCVGGVTQLPPTANDPGNISLGSSTIMSLMQQVRTLPDRVNYEGQQPSDQP